MAQGDWVPDELDLPWLTQFDVRTLVAGVPAGPVGADDPVWETLHDNGLLPSRVRDAIEGLRGSSPATMAEALVDLGWTVCSDGNTSASGAFVVPMLIRAAADTSAQSRADALQLIGDLARVFTLNMEMRPSMLWVMQPMPVYDSSGYLENWAVEAARMMVGRDTDLLVELLDDDDPDVRGRAAYVLVTALPVDGDLVEILRLRLAAETVASVRMILVICIAQHLRELDQVPEALAWSRANWSDRASPLEIRLGGVIAWLNLTDEAVPPELRKVLSELPMPAVRELSEQLPWIWWLNYQTDGIANWWQRLIQ
ncbi:hypothetical protein GCM10009827_106650 [Dactylosporangium maewongense]|uniref:HEAT repeat domain-containing protein n=1 Tax=Dactylosporangium maewongense TaxID=634393 RepID=A0ABP4NTU2_9ACTN